jgi:hypothetical protein
LGYYPFGMMQEGRQFVGGMGYRWGFNGQENVNEIIGTGNHTTAMYWEYDTRLGKRWNSDPVVKPWRSPYDAFNNNPVIYIDPNGDDDYYNEKGQYLFTDTKTSTDIRIITQINWNTINNQYSAEIADITTSYMGLLTSLEANSKLVTLDADEATKIKRMWFKSNPDGAGATKKEHAAQFILDVDKAKLYVNEIDPTGNTRDGSSLPVPERLDGVNYVRGDRTKVIVGVFHTHPNKPEEGYSIDVNNQPIDEMKAIRRQYQSYTIDQDGIDKISATSPTTSINTNNLFSKDQVFSGEKSLLRDALESSGGKTP